MYKCATMVVAVGLSLTGVAWANVVIDTVPVGNPGNAGELSGSGSGAGGYGPDRVCGSVAYSYNIGKYEVTAGQYTAFLNKVGGVDAYGLYNTDMWSISEGCKIQRSGGGTVGDPYTYSVAADFANRPVNFVSWGDSARFANWLHNAQPTGAQNASTTENGSYFLNGATSNAALLAVTRKANATWVIPSEDEWYKAAYYKGGSTNAGYWDYPTSSDMVPGRDMADESGNNANYCAGGGPYPIDSGKYTTVVGEFQNSDSPYGTFDQGGNVWESNEAVLYASYRGLRGGSFHSSSGADRNLHAAFRYYGYYPTDEYMSFGFRVSEVPEPATIVLLALASVGIIRKRPPQQNLWVISHRGGAETALFTGFSVMDG